MAKPCFAGRSLRGRNPRNTVADPACESAGGVLAMITAYLGFAVLVLLLTSRLWLA
jgi:hypothetical protein